MSSKNTLVMHDKNDEVRLRVRGGKVQAVYVRSDNVPVGCGEADDPETAVRKAVANALDASGVEARKAKAMLES